MTDESRRYNGWTNYETWAVNLWISNDPETEDMARELTIDAINEHGKDAARSYLADSLKGWITDDAPDLGATLYADLLGGALSEVDWWEIAEGYIEAYNDAADSPNRPDYDEAFPSTESTEGEAAKPEEPGK